MKFFNVCTKKSFEKNGETKTVWPICGTLLVLDDGKKFLELNIFPNTPFYIFEKKKRDTPINTPEEEGIQGEGW